MTQMTQEGRFMKIKNPAAICPKMRQQVERLQFLPQDPNRPKLPPMEETRSDVRIIKVCTDTEIWMRGEDCIGIRRL